ncbi:MAG: prepilin-type N-terminal cleavage/methylation domain-containing protein [Candidatus Zixiibacteriota bacterium]
MMLGLRHNESGFSLIEVTVLIVVIGIIMGIAMQSMQVTVDDYRRTKTELEMEMLSSAIVGDPEMTNTGVRSDFGYIGDVGAFPPNLQALYTNPGGYATWSGPYVPSGFTQDNVGFKTDEWGKLYTYTGGVTISSTGSGTTITKRIADAATDYTSNQLKGTVTDVAGRQPGSTYWDSVSIVVSIPNGSGGTLSKSYQPDSTGSFTLDSLPVGTHSLDLIYLPNVDTLHRFVTILPRHKSQVSYSFATSYFDTSGGGGGGSGVDTLRPMGAGSESNLLDEGCSGTWSCVDDVTPDGDGTFVKGYDNAFQPDLYATQDHTAAGGTVDSVVVYIRSKGSGGGKKVRTRIKTNGVTYNGAQVAPSGSYANYSTTYITNPQTSSAWTWTEIDALEIGVAIKKEAFTTQVWVEVYYTN